MSDDYTKGQSAFNNGGLPFGLGSLGQMGYNDAQEQARQAEQRRQENNQPKSDTK